MGVLFASDPDSHLNDLTIHRTTASLPFGGRYRLIDFTLSNLVHANITTIGIVTRNNYNSLMDHLRMGRDWDLNRKNSGLTLFPPFAFNSEHKVYKGKIEALFNLRGYLMNNNEEYVVISNTNIAYNIDFDEVEAFHIEKGSTITVRTVLRALHEGDKAVIGNATGCLEVSTFMYPYTAYEDSYIHNAFENAGATLSGVETAYNVLKKKGKIDDTYKFITFGGDGGTYDIGLQSLSGAMERGHDMVYVCYDNGAYMNTGIQRSSATPMYADTTTTPVGSQSNGKMQNRKDLAQVMAAHDIPYVGQSTLLGNMRDLYEKAEKAIYTPGAAFLNVMSPCPRGWRYPTEKIMDICKLAVETCYWPLFEVIEGKWILSYSPKKKLPIEDFLRTQGRFKHLFKPENEHLLVQYQQEVDRRWEDLLYRCSKN